jgi:DNA repair exonuclease SbcCD nuclease subunit
MKVLWVGDSHLKKQQLADAESYIGQLLAIIARTKPDQVVLAGDQTNEFDAVSASVLALWARFFREAPQLTSVVVLVGNHDMAGTGGGASSMEVFKAYPDVAVVDRPMEKELYSDVYYFPFMRDTAEFEKQCRALAPGGTLFCHQSFNGAQFENGFYDPHGADPSCVAHLSAVVSGHVHRRQTVENIFYPGTPFQHTFSDAGETKAVFGLNLGKEGYTIGYEWKLDMPTFEVVRADTIPELLERLPEPSASTHYKLVAKGAPSEIAQFWREEKVRTFRSGAKRVVDALTSIKPLSAISTVKGSTQKEKLDDFILNKKWRTDAGQLARTAQEYVGS